MIRRLFWVGVGVTITVVVIRQGRKVIARYTPEAIQDRAAEVGRDVARRTSTFTGAFRDEFGRARAEREDELVRALLAEGQPHPDEVRAQRAARSQGAGAAAGATGAWTAAEADIAADEDDLGYSF